MKIGDRVLVLPFDCAPGVIVEVKNKGLGDYYRVRCDDGLCADLDALELRPA